MLLKKVQIVIALALVTTSVTIALAGKAQAASGVPESIAADESAAKTKGLKNNQQTLAYVQSNRDSNVSRLAAVLDQGGKVNSIRFDTKHMDQSPAVTTTLTFDMKQISSSRGAVLLNVSGYDAVILNATLDNKVGQGALTVRYLTNAFFGSYDSCHALVRRGSEGKWQIINVYNKQPVQTIMVQGHSTGISTIQGICPQ
jgi:hypothetical protein